MADEQKTENTKAQATSVEETKTDNKSSDNYTADDLKKAKIEGIEAGRSEAKQQLYSKLDEQAKELKQLKSQLEQTSNGNNEFQEKLKNALGVESEDKEPSIDELLARQQEQFNSRIEDISKKFEKKISKSDEQLQQLNQRILENAKEKIVAENEGKIIPELLQGNSEEELRASAEKARQAYEALEEKITSQMSQQEKEAKKGKQLPPKSQASSTGAAGGVEEPSLEDTLNNTSDEEFLEKDQDIRSQLNKMLQQG